MVIGMVWVLVLCVVSVGWSGRVSKGGLFQLVQVMHGIGTCIVLVTRLSYSLQ